MGVGLLSLGVALLGYVRPASGGLPSFVSPTPEIGQVTSIVGFVGRTNVYSLRASAYGNPELAVMWNAQDEYRPDVSPKPFQPSYKP